MRPILSSDTPLREQKPAFVLNDYQLVFHHDMRRTIDTAKEDIRRRLGLFMPRIGITRVSFRVRSWVSTSIVSAWCPFETHLFTVPRCYPCRSPSRGGCVVAVLVSRTRVNVNKKCFEEQKTRVRSSRRLRHIQVYMGVVSGDLCSLPLPFYLDYGPPLPWISEEKAAR